MRLTLERFGGIAGIPAKPLILDTSSLPEAQAKQLEALAQRVLDEGVTRSKKLAPKPDAVSYEVTIEAEAEHARRAVAFDSTQASEALRELVKAMRTSST